MVARALSGLLLLVAATAGPASAQQSPTLGAERRSYAEWLATASTSPLAAVAMHRMTGPVTLGPDTSDIPLHAFGPATVVERRGVVTLTGPDGTTRALPRGRPVVVAPWTFQVQGVAGSSVLLVYGPPAGTPPGWYPPDPTLAFTAPLEAPVARERRRVLTLDGIEVEGELAGFISVPLGHPATRLQVMRMPVPGTEETELQVYFRDLTNAHGTYPAGRFVEVTPAEAGRYRIDFNRARNPFCAYSSVYPCPVPWPGNSIPTALAAGEQYLPHKSGR
jgi:hypothetical protein